MLKQRVPSLVKPLCRALAVPKAQGQGAMTTATFALARLLEHYPRQQPLILWLAEHREDVAVLLEERGIAITAGLLDIGERYLRGWVKGENLRVKGSGPLTRDKFRIVGAVRG